jgi:hypothetical protein
MAFQFLFLVAKKPSGNLLHMLAYDAAIISVDNAIYVAGGRSQPGNQNLYEVWKLEY